jgi:hypothetical protein
MKRQYTGIFLVGIAALVGAGVVIDHIRSAPAAVVPAPVVQQAALSDSQFAQLVARVSEPGGFFDSDNLISNETGYLHPLPKLNELGVSGGAYLGVGPDQNYSYIAAIRPQIAFMVDIRRDAGLQHLLYKQLMSRSRNRMEYLCLLLGRPVPYDIQSWTSRSLTAMLDQIDRIPRAPAFFDSTRSAVRQSLAGMAHPIAGEELDKVADIHRDFFIGGLDLQYTSLNRRGRRNYPTFRSLLLERDVNGDQVGYLTSENRFQYVKLLHARNLIVPVAGNLAGGHALQEIGRYLREQSLTVSALYVSNVEFYLVRDRLFDPFAQNVAALPRTAQTVIIRSVFDNDSAMWFDNATGASNEFSRQLMGTVNAFVRTFQNGDYRSYSDIVTRGLTPLRGG